MGQLEIDTQEDIGGDATEAAMGARIRARRLQLGLTLDDLSKRVGLAKSFLSQVERGRNSPSLNTLRSISEALDVPILYFFLYENEAQPVIRAGKRRIINHPGGGMLVELLSPDLQHNIELVLVRIHPGHDSSAGGTRHRGDECFLVLEGQADMDLGTEIVKLEAGDSSYILASQYHLVRNTGDSDVVVISSLTPPSF